MLHNTQQRSHIYRFLDKICDERLVRFVAVPDAAEEQAVRGRRRSGSRSVAVSGEIEKHVFIERRGAIF